MSEPGPSRRWKKKRANQIDGIGTSTGVEERGEIVLREVAAMCQRIVERRRIHVQYCKSQETALKPSQRVSKAHRKKLAEPRLQFLFRSF